MIRSVIVPALVALGVTSAFGAGAVQLVDGEQTTPETTVVVSESPSIAPVPVVEAVAEPEPTTASGPDTQMPAGQPVSEPEQQPVAADPASEPVADEPAPDPAPAPAKPACTSPTGCNAHGVPLPPPPAENEGPGPANGDAGFNGPGINP